MPRTPSPLTNSLPARREVGHLKNGWIKFYNIGQAHDASILDCRVG